MNKKRKVAVGVLALAAVGTAVAIGASRAHAAPSEFRGTLTSPKSTFSVGEDIPLTVTVVDANDLPAENRIAGLYEGKTFAGNFPPTDAHGRSSLVVTLNQPGTYLISAEV